MKEFVKIYVRGKDKFADPYTVVIDNAVYTMSGDPTHPQGVGMYSGELGELGLKTENFGKKIAITKVPPKLRAWIERQLIRITEGE
jgi:hypothetical protein